MPNFLTTRVPGVIQTATYFKRPLPPSGEAAWLSKSISQPTFTLYSQQPVFPFIKVSTVAPIVPTGFASWATCTISQPVIYSAIMQTPQMPFISIAALSTKQVKLQGYSHGWSYPI